MKVVQINTNCGTGSTGKICAEISQVLSKHSVENYILYSSGKSDYPLGIKYTNEKYIKLQAFFSRLNGRYGFNSKYATKKIIKILNRIKPDVIHLHNLHGHNCNLEMLFDYIRENSVKVFWTFHDCWAFTGYCPHYSMAKCDSWIDVCNNCKQRKKFSWFLDCSTQLHKKKKLIIEGVDITVITPSQWMARQVATSFYGKCKLVVINNGIDLDVFKPLKSSFRKEHHIEKNKKVLLGVAANWGERKGLDIFIKLAECLDSTKFQIVLVGTNEETRKALPNNIITIEKTNNQSELAEIYSSADLFVNPTREDTFPTVNIEALACGLPIVTFKTGGSVEIIDDTCGVAVDCDDFDELKKQIEYILENDIFDGESCLERAKQFNKIDKFQYYYELYQAIEFEEGRI